jgi:Ca2+-binding EF-hand superfamily protein
MKHSLIALCSTALLCGAAWGNDDKSTDEKHDTFSTLDQDNDGRLSKQEVEGHGNLADSFSMLDRNSDGYVTKKEFRRNTMPKPRSDY